MLERHRTPRKSDGSEHLVLAAPEDQCAPPSRFSAVISPLLMLSFKAQLQSTCPPWPRSYNAPMLDIKLIRERPDFVRQRLASRGAGDDVAIDEVLKLDEQRRKLLAEVESLKAQRNRVSKEIGALMGQKKPQEAEAKKSETRQMGDQIAQLDAAAAKTEAELKMLMLQLPNLPHESVPAGKTVQD